MWRITVSDLEEIQRIRSEARIDLIRGLMGEEQLQQMQRSRSIGSNESGGQFVCYTYPYKIGEITGI